MFASSAILRQIRPASAPVFRAAARPIPVQMQMQAPMRINNVGLQMARRWNTQENKGGKSKLVSIPHLASHGYVGTVSGR